MDLKVIGCHGGETPKHRTSAFILDDRVAIDAGSLTSGIELKAQYALEACLVSHAHLDHIRDLATIADNRAQNGCPPLVVAGTEADDRDPEEALLQRPALAGLHEDPERRSTPTIRYQVLKPEVRTKIAGYTRARHPREPHDRVRRVHRREQERRASRTAATRARPTASGRCSTRRQKLRALLMEVSFPNERAAGSRR